VPGCARTETTTSMACVPPAVTKMSSVVSLYGRSLDRCSARALCIFLKKKAGQKFSVRIRTDLNIYKAPFVSFHFEELESY
jgi:hypothetical protein